MRRLAANPSCRNLPPPFPGAAGGDGVQSRNPCLRHCTPFPGCAGVFFCTQVYKRFIWESFDRARRCRTWQGKEGRYMTTLTLVDTDRRPDTTTIRDLGWYDYILVSFSGGKDSVALVLRLLKLGVPKHKII